MYEPEKIEVKYARESLLSENGVEENYIFSMPTNVKSSPSEL